MDKRRAYNEESKKLLIVIDIAIESFQKYMPVGMNQSQIDRIVSIHEEWKNEIINTSPESKNLKSLKYRIEDVFTYFIDGSGETVAYFWKKLEEENLNYKYENKLKKILKRGTINNIHDYNHVIDMIVVSQQLGLISSEDSKMLNKLLGEFESRKK
ncbi:hypothetical protein [Winogradskyella tangerina]|uniref:hypothetical protein n=1 Tax=Winogradskyella tangerina TaxID=2023240 RepID=UPI000DBE582E|nr:hypothetical protein [Winogradskyella tangerina]